jgi:hypothetical protein
LPYLGIKEALPEIVKCIYDPSILTNVKNVEKFCENLSVQQLYEDSLNQAMELWIEFGKRGIKPGSCVCGYNDDDDYDSDKYYD